MTMNHIHEFLFYIFIKYREVSILQVIILPGQKKTMTRSNVAANDVVMDPLLP